MKPLRLCFGAMLILWVCSACTSLVADEAITQEYAAWQYSDVRRLDPDEASDPENDLLTVYTRQTPGSIDIRLDLLDSAQIPDFDLYIPIDYQPGGSNSLPIEAQSAIDWDILLQLTANHAIQVLRYDPERNEVVSDRTSGVLVIRDPSLDTVTIRIQRLLISKQKTNRLQQSTRDNIPYQFEVFLTASGGTTPLDHIPPSQSNDPPPEPARLLLAFWNTYPAYTPALSLRRWDGAHTGPEGGRHGLYNLIRTSRSAGVPVFLLDLIFPQGLSALDFSTQIDYLRTTVADGQVTLSAPLPSSLTMPVAPEPVLMDRFFEKLLAANHLLGYPTPVSFFAPYGVGGLGDWIDGGGRLTGSLVFIPSQSLQDGTGMKGEELTATSSMTTWGQLRVLPIPGYHTHTPLPEQATQDGPSLSLNRAITQVALSASGPTDNHSLLVLGGDLPASAWGIPQSARATFRYLSSRPWIHFLDLRDLLAYPLSTSPSSTLDQPPSTGTTSQEAELYQALLAAPTNELTDAAWDYWQSLYAPIYPYWQNMSEIRTSHLDQAWSLLEASYWADYPQEINTCSLDMDRDGNFDCILSSENYYLHINPQDSSIRYAFYRDSKGQSNHQVIGPSTQVITGLSDPSLASTSTFTDLSIIPGAFREPQPPDGYNNNKHELEFYWGSGIIERKTYRLTGEGVQVDYILRDNQTPIVREIPLLLDPWERFSKAWSQSYNPAAANNLVTWSLADSVIIQVSVNNQPQLTSFQESIDYMGQPEDPNQDYPAGHYLPFPLALVKVSISEGSPVVISIIPPGNDP